MAEDTPDKEQPKYYRLVDLERSYVESSLPIERDEGGKQEGYRGTRVEYELQRLNQQWSKNNERRLGVGKKVVIKAGTPIRMWHPNALLGDYIATEDMAGTLKKEATEYLRERQIDPSKGTHMSNMRLEWQEMAHSLFEVTVELPPTQDETLRRDFMQRVNILVPNDMLQLAEEPSTPLSESNP